MKAIDYLKSDECPNIKNGMNLNELQLYLIAQVMEGYHAKQCAINGVGNQRELLKSFAEYLNSYYDTVLLDIDIDGFINE